MKLVYKGACQDDKIALAPKTSKAKMDRFNYIKIKHFYFCKHSFGKMKRQVTDQEKIFATSFSVQMSRELPIGKKRVNNALEKWPENMVIYSMKRSDVQLH